MTASCHNSRAFSRGCNKRRRLSLYELRPAARRRWQHACDTRNTEDVMNTPDALGSAASGAIAPIIYYVLWRSHATRPWHSEELFTRIDAHNKYSALIQRGYEA